MPEQERPARLALDFCGARLERREGMEGMTVGDALPYAK